MVWNKKKNQDNALMEMVVEIIISLLLALCSYSL